MLDSLLVPIKESLTVGVNTYDESESDLDLCICTDAISKRHDYSS